MRDYTKLSNVGRAPKSRVSHMLATDESVHPGNMPGMGESHVYQA